MQFNDDDKHKTTHRRRNNKPQRWRRMEMQRKMIKKQRKEKNVEGKEDKYNNDEDYYNTTTQRWVEFKWIRAALPANPNLSEWVPMKFSFSQNSTWTALLMTKLTTWPCSRHFYLPFFTIFTNFYTVFMFLITKTLRSRCKRCSRPSSLDWWGRCDFGIKWNRHGLFWKSTMFWVYFM